MAKKSISELVSEFATPIVENLGYELVEVKYAKGHSGMELTLFIYSKQGISLEDCEKVSRAIDEPLDELNPTNDVSYTLNVSSLGLDRPIKTAKDAERNLNKKIDVKLYASVDGKKVYTGILTAYTEKDITIKLEKEEKTFRFDEIALASPVIDF
jgi:ribosome maturation factor RimP